MEDVAGAAVDVQPWWVPGHRQMGAPAALDGTPRPGAGSTAEYKLAILAESARCSEHG